MPWLLARHRSVPTRELMNDGLRLPRWGIEPRPHGFREVGSTARPLPPPLLSSADMAKTFEFVLQFVCCDTVSYLSNTYWIGRLIGTKLWWLIEFVCAVSMYVITCQWQCNDSAVSSWRCFAVDGGTLDQCIGVTAGVQTLPTYGNSTWTYPILCNEVRIGNSITLTSSAFYPIRILLDPHFTNLYFI